MALSFCSSFGYHEQQDHLTVYPQTETEVATELLGWDDNLNTVSDFFINPLFEFDELFSSDTNTNILPYFSSPSDNLISLSPDIIPLHELDSFQFPKRQIIYHEDCQSNLPPNFLDGYVANADPVMDFLPEIPSALPKFEAPAAGFNVGSSDSSSVKKASGRSFSAQSIAARERRRKITEKTQELGKLIPGGNKMNTAEMLQSASNYVKFLQAQIRVLEIIESTFQEKKEDLHKDELQILLASLIIQEKLYSEEKCLVPRGFLETIAKDAEFQSAPLVLDEIGRLLGANR